MELSSYPSDLKNLVCDLKDSESKNFIEYIRSYRMYFSALAFASMGAKLEVPKGNGPFVFRIHGQIYHNTYSLHPNDANKRKYDQLCIIDTNQALQEPCYIQMWIKRDRSLDKNKYTRPSPWYALR